MRISDWSSDVCSSDLLPIGKTEDHDDAEHTRAELLTERTRDAVQSLQTVRTRWHWLLNNLDMPLAQGLQPLLTLGLQDLETTLSERLAQQPDATVFDIVQDHTIRISWKTEVRSQMERF